MAVEANDIRAALDVVAQLMGEIDDLGVDAAIELRAELKALTKAAGDAASLLETHAVNSLDGQPRQIGNTVWMARTTGKWRPEHERIKQRVIDFVHRECIDPATGEMLPIEAAIRRTVNIMYDGFVAPTSMPKRAFQDKLGVDDKEIGHWERGRKELKAMDVETEVDP